ncbi:DUF362 domain-containing protein [Candidatus Woesearchaeota archaeon]|nr:DUF362 domain-containing protein [Candidatus Woesearchaeota archaeon]
MMFSESEQEFLQKIKPGLTKFLSPNEKIAVKLHMGEKGNKTYPDPDFVKKIVDILKENNCIPFLFDSPVMYPGARDSSEKYFKIAAENGFSHDKIGCPVIISNDFEHVKTSHLNAGVCKPLIEADSILVLSHVKGHMCSGIGGAIKNIGMGAVSKKTKADIHNLANPMVTADCTFCQSCVKACPVNAITAEAGKIRVHYDGCWGCGQCVNICPSHALKPKVASFDTLIAEGAFAVLSKVKKCYFINVLTKISRLCDCQLNNGPIVLSDIGYLASDDIIEIEEKSIDLINKKAGKNLFLEIHKKDPYVHVKEMERLILA